MASPIPTSSPSPGCASGLDAVQAGVHHDPCLRHHRDPFSADNSQGNCLGDPHPQRPAESKEVTTVTGGNTETGQTTVTTTTISWDTPLIEKGGHRMKS